MDAFPETGLGWRERKKLRTRAFIQLDEIVAVVAERARHSSDAFAVRNLAGALLGVMMATFLSAANDPEPDVLGLADHTLAHLEAALPLEK